MFFVNKTILIEGFGYIGTALVVISMLMTSLNKLRIVNICGSIISMIYSIIVKAYPVALLNFCLIIVNMTHLIRRFIIIKRNQKEV